MRRVLVAAVAGLVALGATPTTVFADEPTAEAAAEATIENLNAARDACLSSLERFFQQTGFPEDQAELALDGFETILSQLVDPRIAAIDRALGQLEDGTTPALEAAVAAGKTLLTVDQKSLIACPVPGAAPEDDPAEGTASPAGPNMEQVPGHAAQPGEAKPEHPASDDRD